MPVEFTFERRPKQKEEEEKEPKFDFQRVPPEPEPELEPAPIPAPAPAVEPTPSLTDFLDTGRLADLPPEADLPSLGAAGRGLVEATAPIGQALAGIGPRFEEPVSQEPIFTDVPAIEDPAFAGKVALGIAFAPFAPIAAVLRSPGAFTEADVSGEDPAAIERREASLLDLAGRAARPVFRGFAAGGIPEAPFVEDLGLSEDMAEQVGRVGTELAALHYGMGGLRLLARGARFSIQRNIRNYLLEKGWISEEAAAETIADLFAEDAIGNAMHFKMADETLPMPERVANARGFHRRYKYPGPNDPRTGAEIRAQAVKEGLPMERGGEILTAEVKAAAEAEEAAMVRAPVRPGEEPVFEFTRGAEPGVAAEAPPVVEAPPKIKGPTEPLLAKGGVPFKTERGARLNIAKAAKRFDVPEAQLTIVPVSDGFGIVDIRAEAPAVSGAPDFLAPKNVVKRYRQVLGEAKNDIERAKIKKQFRTQWPELTKQFSAVERAVVEVSPAVAAEAVKKPVEAVAPKPRPTKPTVAKAPPTVEPTPPGVAGVAEERIVTEPPEVTGEKPTQTIDTEPARVFVTTAKKRKVARNETLRWIDGTIENMQRGLIKEGGSIEMSISGVEFMVPNTRAALQALRKEIGKFAIRKPRKVQAAPEVRELARAAPSKTDYVPVGKPPKGKEPLWTNGSIIDKGDRPPVGSKIPDAPEVPFARLEQDFEKARVHVGKKQRKGVNVRFAKNPETGKPDITASIVNQAGEEITVRSDDIGFFMTKYPDAEFYFKPQFIKRTDTVPVMEKGEVVGHEKKVRREAIGDIAVVSEGRYVGTFKSVGAFRNLGAKFNDAGKLQDYAHGTADFLDTRRPSERAYGYASAGTDTSGAEQFPGHLSNAVDIPEIVDFAKLLMDGEVPRVVTHIDRHGNVLGRFIPGGTGRILLRADIFRDPELARMVISHEVGHVVDYYPEGRMKRGNILGRIKSFKGIYRKHLLPRFPGAKETLTTVDRRRLRSQAEKIIREEYKDKWIDEVITKEMPIEPQDVLNIWNAVDQAGLTNPDMQRFIAELSGVEKKAIVKEALKGVVPNQLQQFAKKIKEKTGKQIKAEIPDDAVAKKYAELIDEEIQKLRLFKIDEVMDELKTLTRTWRPFDPMANPQYTAIRYSPEELYADSISVLFNKPGLLKSVAPNFYEGFFNYLDENPRVAELWHEIQDRINAGTTNTTLVMNTKKGYRGGDDAYALALKKPQRRFDHFMREIVDQHWAIIKKVKRYQKQGFDLPAEENPRFAIEKMLMSGSSTEWVATRVDSTMRKPLEEVGLDWDDFGLYRQLIRIEDSVEAARQAQPQGWTPERAAEQLKEWETKTWAGEKWETMQQVSDNFTNLNREIIDKVAETKYFPQEVIDLMREKVGVYATWDVVRYVEERMGAIPSAKIFPKVGTLEDITNPATATILKNVAIMKAANRARMGRITANFLHKYQEAFGTEVEGITIRPAEKKWNGKFMEIKNPKPGSGLGLLVYLEEGKAVGWYVDKFLAEAFDRNPIESWWTARTLNTFANPFRQIFTEVNPGFIVFNTFFRDPMRAAQMLPGANLRKFLAVWPKAVKPAWRSVFGIPDDVAEFMLKNEMLISIESARGLSPTDKELERWLKRMSILPRDWNNQVIKPFAQFINFVGNVGRVGERSGKIASMLYLQKHFPDMPLDQLRHEVMVKGGSPAFMRVGRMHPILNSFELFFNAWKEGNRGDFEAMTTTPLEFWYKKGKYIILPKLLMFAAAAGWIGEGYRRVMQGVSTFDMANYIVVPLGLTPSGKSIYLRIPTDESNRLIGGIFTKMLEVEKPKMRRELLAYMAGQAPTVNPAIGAILSTVQYASGFNPYDGFRGRYAIPESLFIARDERTHKAFIKWLGNKYGANVVYRFKHDDLEQIRTELEEFLDIPVASNIFGRFLKVTDVGVKQELKYRRELVKRENARKVLDAKEALTKYLNDDPMTEADLLALAEKPDIWDRNFMKFMARKHGDAVAEELFSVYHTGSEEEKFAVWEAIREMNVADNPGDKYRWIWQNDKFIGKGPGFRFEFKRRGKVMPKFKFERLEKGRVTRR